MGYSLGGSDVLDTLIITGKNYTVVLNTDGTLGIAVGSSAVADPSLYLAGATVEILSQLSGGTVYASFGAAGAVLSGPSATFQAIGGPAYAELSGSGLQLFSGGITISAGGISVTGGSVAISSGGISVAGGSVAITGGNVSFATSGDGIIGTATNDNAATGNVGEYVTASVASPGGSLSNGTPASVTSISLTAGDWDVWGDLFFVAGSSTVTTVLQGWVSTSASLPTAPAAGALALYQTSTTGNILPSLNGMRTRISLAAPTTVFLATQAAFSTSTLKAYGSIQARRVR